MLLLLRTANCVPAGVTQLLAIFFIVLGSSFCRSLYVVQSQYQSCFEPAQICTYAWKTDPGQVRVRGPSVFPTRRLYTECEPSLK